MKKVKQRRIWDEGLIWCWVTTIISWIVTIFAFINLQLKNPYIRCIVTTGMVLVVLNIVCCAIVFWHNDKVRGN